MRPENKTAIQKNVDVEIRNFLDEYIDISAIINDVIEKMDFQDAVRNMAKSCIMDMKPDLRSLVESMILSQITEAAVAFDYGKYVIERVTNYGKEDEGND